MTDPLLAAPAGTLTVVVPACDEEAVIDRCLDALLGHGAEQVVVVCNGCTDATPELVRRRAAGTARLHLVELLQGSKSGAVAAGLRASPAGAVAVVDADVVLSDDALAGLRQVLDSGAPRIAAPAPVVDTSGCSAVVRSFYRAWSCDPYVAGGLVGAGVYAVNQAGRARLTPFPQVLADDGWARAQFVPAERATSAGTFTIRPARSLAALVRRRARVELGNRQLRGLPRAPAGPPGARATPASCPASAVDLVVYRGVSRLARGLARWRTFRGTAGTWGRDDTSRRPAGASAPRWPAR